MNRSRFRTTGHSAKASNNTHFIGRLVIASALGASLLTSPAAAQDNQPLTAQEHQEWAAIGKVNTGGLAKVTGCTGALIAPDLVLTAAHCVPERALRADEPESVHFIAGWFRGEYAAHGTSRVAHVHPAHVRGRHGLDALFSDVALLVLDEPLPAEAVTPLRIAEFPSFADDVEIIAYSNRRPGALARTGPCTAVPVSTDALGLTCPVRGGNSGAPVLRRDEEGWAIVAVTVAQNTGEGALRSFAVRIPDELLELAGPDLP